MVVCVRFVTQSTCGDNKGTVCACLEHLLQSSFPVLSLQCSAPLSPEISVVAV